MLLYILLIIILLMALLPQWWAKRILAHYSRERSDLPGTGGELAQHLLRQFKLQDVRLESTEQGDHYDPQSRTVRLTEANLQGRSLTAVATAAHEVGHALQHACNYSPLTTRTRLVLFSQQAERLGSGALLLTPVLATVAPPLATLSLLLALAGMLTNTLVHLATLPVEWDASFQRALPVLRDGHYLSPRDLRAARRILTACALTYAASSLASLLNIWRWLRILRR